MEPKPIKNKRGRAVRYDWATLKGRGWIFLPLVDRDGKKQADAVRAAARNHGIRVSACAATSAGVSGFMVEVTKRGVK